MTLGAIRSTGLTASRALAEWTAEKLFPNDSRQEQNEPVMPPPGMHSLWLLPCLELLVYCQKLAKLGRISEVGRMSKKLGAALHRGTVRSSHQAVPGSNLKTLKEQKDDDK